MSYLLQGVRLFLVVTNKKEKRMEALRQVQDWEQDRIDSLERKVNELIQFRKMVFTLYSVLVLVTYVASVCMLKVTTLYILYASIEWNSEPGVSRTFIWLFTKLVFYIMLAKFVFNIINTKQWFKKHIPNDLTEHKWQFRADCVVYVFYLIWGCETYIDDVVSPYEIMLIIVLSNNISYCLLSFCSGCFNLFDFGKNHSVFSLMLFVRLLMFSTLEDKEVLKTCIVIELFMGIVLRMVIVHKHAVIDSFELLHCSISLMPVLNNVFIAPYMFHYFSVMFMLSIHTVEHIVWLSRMCS